MPSRLWHSAHVSHGCMLSVTTMSARAKEIVDPTATSTRVVRHSLRAETDGVIGGPMMVVPDGAAGQRASSVLILERLQALGPDDLQEMPLQCDEFGIGRYLPAARARQGAAGPGRVRSERDVVANGLPGEQ